MRLTDSQIRRALRGADTFTKQDGTKFLGYHEQETIETNTGEVTESEYILCARGTVAMNEIVMIDGKKHRIQYIKDDKSGLVEAFISLTGGAHEKYR
ncbi:hypothetical protein [Edwardsiella tarda]|uniref:hypothetical protein n=1 Tax=Edwardsiella tarda TaxID=636 RepID=UPI000FDB876F|nr:hypothetical protein [Edwardsiella tarda]